MYFCKLGIPHRDGTAWLGWEDSNSEISSQNIPLQVAQISGILHSMLQFREDRGNLILKLQTPLLEPCENLVGGRLFPRLDAIDISVDFVVALRESPELIIGPYHPLDKRDLLRKLIS